jgi:hypothetical protein
VQHAFAARFRGYAGRSLVPARCRFGGAETASAGIAPNRTGGTVTRIRGCLMNNRKRQLRKADSDAKYQRNTGMRCFSLVAKKDSGAGTGAGRPLHFRSHLCRGARWGSPSGLVCTVNRQSSPIPETIPLGPGRLTVRRPCLRFTASAEYRATVETLHWPRNQGWQLQESNLSIVTESSSLLCFAITYCGLFRDVYSQILMKYRLCKLL